MEREVSKRPIFRPTSSIVMLQRVLHREMQLKFFRPRKCQGDHDKEMLF